MIAEGLIHGQAVNLDGYVENGVPEVLGICDEHMYPNTDAFSHFEYPSCLSRAVQARIAEVGKKAIRAIGFRHGFFNMELAYDRATDCIRIIEINPRMASQMMSLYADALGIDAYPMEAELALGRRPPRGAPRPHPGVAGSFAFRRFDGRQVTAPTQAQLDRVKAEVPDATLMQYIKPMSGLRHEMRWMGSYRYALVNFGAPDQAELYRRFARIARILGWDDVDARGFAPLFVHPAAAQ
jgi:biotin carboxylase